MKHYKSLRERYKNDGREDYDAHARNVAEQLVVQKFGKELAKQAKESQHGT